MQRDADWILAPANATLDASHAREQLAMSLLNDIDTGSGGFRCFTQTLTACV